jgi:cation diffusion facilitator CzcD-associated flavoprotein CzcO
MLIRIREVTVERTETGETFVDKADVVISARGALNDMKWPSIPGFESLKIPIMHSADWDKK